MVGAMPSGEQRQANLRILFERARQFEQTSYKGLFNFVNFIDRLKTGKGDMGSAKILGENDNVVRIMSIHKSKGLEFPVVILSGCGKIFNMQDMNKGILLHQDLGFGPDVVNYMTRVSWPSAAKQAIREKIKAETLSEEMRILYVALTRAREKLIITGIVKDAEKVVTKWFAQAGCPGSRLPDYEVLKGNNYLDWIGPALMRHKDCGVLRQYASMGNEYKNELIDDSSKWIIKLWNKNDAKNSRIVEKHNEDRFLQWLAELDNSETSEYADEIARRLSWEYSFSNLTNIPAKLSVTELKRRYNVTSSENADSAQVYLPPLVKKPAFLEEKQRLSAAERGTILHFVMQHLDFKNPAILSQIQTMVTKDLLTMQQAQSVDIERISRFLSSSIGKRMLASSALYREVPFNIEIPCNEVYQDIIDDSTSESILLQGVIDCYFEEQDSIILLDYKTDYVPQGGEEAIRERYKLQVNYYARALEMLTGKCVKEKYIYLFWSGELLEII
jgi:ATP-dependent helicase/nuclease subunit A